MGYCRTLEFIERLKISQTPENVIDKEVLYLRDCYPVVSSLKKAFTIYRNAVKVLDNELEQKCKKGFTLTLEEAGFLKQQTNAQIANEHRNLRPLKDIDGLIVKYEHMLRYSKSYADLILALSGVTGRRVAEIACSATFEKVTNDRVLFKGQLKTKTRGEIEAYEIPVLADSDLIIAALSVVRERAPGLLNNPEKFHNNCSKNLSVRVKKHFEGLIPNPMVKDLRAIYGEISYALLDDLTITKMRYMSDILGHGVNDNVTGQSYLDFYIDDIYYS